MVQYELSNGVIAQLWMSYEVPTETVGELGRYLITGSTGVIDFNAYGDVRVDRGDGQGWETAWETPPFQYLADPFTVNRVKGFANQFQDFLDAIAAGPDAVRDRRRRPRRDRDGRGGGGVGAHGAGGPAPAPMSDSIGVGIVGSGLQGETYAASLAGHVPDARFVAIWGGSRAPELARHGAARPSRRPRRSSAIPTSTS